MKDIKRLPNGNYEIKEEKLRELLENSESYLILMNGGLNHYDFYDDIMGDFDDDGKLRYIPKETMQVVEDIIKQNNRWRAKKGGKYYFISSEGEIDCEYDDYDNVDNARYNFHNYFKTRHEAELKLNKLKED
ncbi:MAG: hypothetical protein SOV85_01845 [Clostridium sp.]|uniref:hypothetical protein n=1 Tax=Clostridium sp. TaxID=1506 RepID=UPI002A74C2CF|nr:hypothetical protein [Clostridium sp.]MDY2630086.1 hypothetical protein [Clostridium sp.]